ncbi:MAG: 5'-nucleotidase, lipoprotein e(P4) family [Halopseudomonas aestusnigri]
MMRTLKLTALTVLMGGTLAGCIATPQNDILNATLWTQKSVEFKANSIAMYELAKIKLDDALADKSWTGAPNEQGDNYSGKPPAVMLDVDETVLDNSAYEAWLVANDQSYGSKTWVPFVRSETSTPVPGSLDFIKYAESKGVKVFYVSNRKAPQEEATRNNLKAYGYPIDTSEDTVLLRKEKEAWNSSKKSPRRAHITENYRLVMVVGDNFSDFVDDYKGTIDERKAVLDKYEDMWGSKWIMISNPMYGSWESAAFGHNWGLTSAERRKLKHESLDVWVPAEE